jgi:hypothetical protein
MAEKTITHERRDVRLTIGGLGTFEGHVDLERLELKQRGPEGAEWRELAVTGNDEKTLTLVISGPFAFIAEGSARG